MPHPGEVLFEFVRLGPVVKVIAVDAATGTEISIVAPATITTTDAERLALQKLSRRLASGRASRTESGGASVNDIVV